MLAAFQTPLAHAEPDFSPLKTPPSAYKDHALEKQARLKDFENQILEKSTSIVNDALAAFDLDVTAGPEQWKGEGTDQKAAERRHRIALAALSKAVDAPVALRIAQQTMLGIIRARAAEKAGPRILNYAVVNLSAPLPEFDVIDVEPDE